MLKIPKALRRFLMGYLVLHLTAAGVFVWFLTGIMRDQMIDHSRMRMVAMAEMLERHIEELDHEIVDSSLPAHLQALGEATGLRFTLVNAEGIVICDSVTGTQDIGYHGDRPEIIAAETGNSGFSERFSSTLENPMMYLAVPYRADTEGTGTGFIRIATPAVSINEAIASMQTIVWLFAFVIVLLTGMLMVWLASRSMRPLGVFAELASRIGAGEYDSAPAPMDRNDEWRLLGVAFRNMQDELESREVSLLKNSARLEAVLSSMIEGVLAVSPDDRVMLANAAACQMLALTKPELIDRKLLDIVRISELGEAIQRTRTEREFSETEFQTVESRRTIRARVSVLADSAVDLTQEPGVAIVLHDVTELRRLENMRRDFVANVSHELKTPLSSIIAYAETLRLGAINDPSKSLQFLGNIESQAQLLNQQIQDLIQLARVESGQEVWEITPIDLNAVCRSCVLRFQSKSDQQQVSIDLGLSDDNPQLRADLEGLETILNNLVSNAIHYTPPKGHITISTATDRNFVVLEVSDSGIGIAPEHHARVFERFYRVDKARSRDKGGTGLGLSIVKHVAISFGGSVELKSRIGHGSTFRVRLPIFNER